MGPSPRGQSAVSVNPMSLTWTSRLLQHTWGPRCSTCKVSKALLIHPSQGETSVFNLHHCNNHLQVLRRIVPYSKLCRRTGKRATGKRSRRCSGHHALGIEGRAPGTEFQETGMPHLSPKGNRAQGDSGLLRAGLQSGSGVCLNTEKKAEEKRDREPHSVVLQHLVILPPLLFLSGKGFKMQSNKKNILEQVSCQSFLSFCLMKAMSSPGQAEVEQDGVSEIPATAGCCCPVIHQMLQPLGRLLLQPPSTRGTGKKAQPTLIKTKLK